MGAHVRRQPPRGTWPTNPRGQLQVYPPAPSSEHDPVPQGLKGNTLHTAPALRDPKTRTAEVESRESQRLRSRTIQHGSVVCLLASCPLAGCLQQAGHQQAAHRHTAHWEQRTGHTGGGAVDVDEGGEQPALFLAFARVCLGRTTAGRGSRLLGARTRRRAGTWRQSSRPSTLLRLFNTQSMTQSNEPAAPFSKRFLNGTCVQGGGANVRRTR